MAAPEQSRINKEENPLVSIIVATFDRGKFLERCIRSILNQTYKSIECIIVDGASKDDSVSILKRLSEEDSRVRWISEPDEGEVYAVNKGLDMARGEIVGFQASDDFYTPAAVEHSVDFLLKNPSYIGVSGDALYVDEEGKELGMGVTSYRGEMSRETIKKIIIVRYRACPVCHGSFFGWRERLLKHGKLDPAFSVTPDWEFYLRLLKNGERIGYIPQIHYKYTAHEEMGAVKHWSKVEEQRKRLYRMHHVSHIHVLLRATIGRLLSYLTNPYRTSFFLGVKREIAIHWSRMKDVHGII
jgi:glycosyltransferase involved in cell wall biosynthesis